MKKERSSNIELLRIVAMLMIIIFHIWIHCINVQSLNDTTYFIKPVVYKKFFLFDVIAPLGAVGNAIFILISGFFMSSKKKVNLEKSAKKILIQSIFSVTILLLGSTIVYKLMNNGRITPLAIDFYNTGSWFIGYYLTIIVSSKFFLNKILDGFNNKEYTAYLIVLFAITQFYWTMLLINSLAEGLNTYLIGIFLYSLGGYIKKYNPFKKINSHLFVVLIAFSFLLVIISNYNANNVAINNYYASNSDGVFIQLIQQYNNHYFIPVVIAICIFELFTRIKIRQNIVINYIGGSTLMIYLIHDNYFVYSICNSTNWLYYLYNNIGEFLYKYLIWTLCIFEVGLMAYIIYNLFTRICPFILKKFFIRE